MSLKASPTIFNNEFYHALQTTIFSGHHLKAIFSILEIHESRMTRVGSYAVLGGAVRVKTL
eukprot:110969-Pelagomonas_calceolata.AAC.1